MTAPSIFAGDNRADQEDLDEITSDLSDLCNEYAASGEPFDGVERAQMQNLRMSCREFLAAHRARLRARAR